jgi:hypothetical protein
MTPVNRSVVGESVLVVPLNPGRGDGPVCVELDMMLAEVLALVEVITPELGYSKTRLFT